MLQQKYQWFGAVNRDKVMKKQKHIIVSETGHNLISKYCKKKGLLITKFCEIAIMEKINNEVHGK